MGGGGESSKFVSFLQFIQLLGIHNVLPLQVWVYAFGERKIANAVW